MVVRARAKPASCANIQALLTGAHRIDLQWRELEVEYAWLPPFTGLTAIRPNRIDMVFFTSALDKNIIKTYTYDKTLCIPTHTSEGAR